MTGFRNRTLAYDGISSDWSGLPQDFGSRSVLAPRAEMPLQLMLGTGARVAGYTVEIFYP